MLLSLALAAFVCVNAKTIAANSGATLLNAISQSTAGDVIELEPGFYLLRSSAPHLPALILDHPLTLRSRDSRQRAVLRSDGASVLAAITSSGVTIENIVFGNQVSGGGQLAIDLYIASGSQALPASPSARYGGAQSAQQTLTSHGEILSARKIQTLTKASVSETAETMRAISRIRIENVDFSRSVAGTNIAFARGAYADISISRSVFGRSGDLSVINAITSVKDALFDNLAVHRNAFFGDAHVLLGSTEVSPASIGLNHWEAETNIFLGHEERVVQTYCLDIECARLAPVIDADRPALAFPSLESAANAGVLRIRVTDDLAIESDVEITKQGTTIEGGEGCDGAPLLTVRGRASIVSQGGALAGARNLRISLQDVGAVAFKLNDESAVPSISLFDGISITGDGSAGQAGWITDLRSSSVELQDAFVIHVETGARVKRGTLVTIDTTFSASTKAAIEVDDSADKLSTLRVRGTTFIGNQVAIDVVGVAGVAGLGELTVKCSTFLFNSIRAPVRAHDCAKKPATCSAAIRFNTIITGALQAQTLENDEGEQRMLRAGMNHVERNRKFEQYVYAGAPKHFSLADDQGRFSWASGALILDDDNAPAATFMIASYAPVRSECLVASESPDVGSAQAAVISDVLEVRADSLLHQCNSLGVRFRVADASTLPNALAVFGVSALGTSATSWQRALATIDRDTASNEVTLESTLSTHDSAQRHQHRIVVVALELLPSALSAAIDSGAALAADAADRVSAQRLCVVCPGTKLPANALDEFCGGTTDHVRSSFDVAYDELRMGVGSGSPRHEPVSLLVFGTCDVTKRCTINIDQNEHIEGVSPIARGTLRVSKTCGVNQPVISFVPRAAKSSLRHIVVVRGTEVATSCAVTIQPSDVQLGPSVVYSTIGSALCISGRSGGRYLNNDIGGTVFVSTSEGENGASAPASPILIEANHVRGGLVVRGGGGNIETVRLDRNMFLSGRIELTGKLITLRALDNAGIVGIVNKGDDSAKISSTNSELVKGAVVALKDHDVFNGGVEQQTLSAVHFSLSSDARIINIHFDATSEVSTATKGSAVVLQKVLFDNVAASLNPKSACARYEVSADGVDLLRSSISVAGNSQLVLRNEESLVIQADKSSYWGAATNGRLEHCANNAVFARSANKCGCPGQAATPIAKAAVKSSAEKVAAVAADAKPKAVAAVTTTSSSRTGAIVGGVIAGVFILIIIGAVFVGVFWSSSSATTVRSAAKASHRAQDGRRRRHNDSDDDDDDDSERNEGRRDLAALVTRRTKRDFSEDASE